MLLVRLGAWVVLLLAVGGLALGAGRHCVLFSYIKLEICITQPLWGEHSFSFGSSTVMPSCTKLDGTRVCDNVLN